MPSPSTLSPTAWAVASLPIQAPGALLTCQHAREEHGWEVVVEVEDPAHQEEWEVMEHPA